MRVKVTPLRGLREGAFRRGDGEVRLRSGSNLAVACKSQTPVSGLESFLNPRGDIKNCGIKHIEVPIFDV